jgi:hypothetical protein
MQVLDRILFSNNWFTLLFVFVLLLLVALKRLNQQKLYGYFTAFFTKGFIVKRTEDQESFFTVFNVILFFFSSFVYAVVLSYFCQYFRGTTFSFSFFIKAFFAVFSYLFVFLLLDISLAKLFEIQNETRYLFSSKITYLHSTSLLLFPIVVLANYSTVSVLFLFGVFIALFSLTTLLLFLNNKNLIINKLFYFILYLCALEIAPLLIFYKIQ